MMGCKQINTLSHLGKLYYVLYDLFINRRDCSLVVGALFFISSLSLSSLFVLVVKFSLELYGMELIKVWA